MSSEVKPDESSESKPDKPKVDDDQKMEKEDKKKPAREETHATKKQLKTGKQKEAEENISAALTGEVTAAEELPAIPIIAEGFANGESLLQNICTGTEPNLDSPAEEQVRDGKPTLESQKQKNLSKLTSSTLAKNVMTFLTENVPKMSKKFAEKNFDFVEEADLTAKSGSDVEPQNVVSDASGSAVAEKSDPGLLISDDFYRDVEEIFQRSCHEDQEEESGGVFPCFLSEFFISNFVDNDWSQIFSSTEL